ncbi:MAG TPA: hypothetical protein VM123_07340 [archaeon]|nr:hypothetical protein [archaeon]
MKNMTISEKMFEQYCEENSIGWTRIVESTEKRPDYYISIAGVNIVVEIKQFDPSKEQKKLLRKFKENGRFYNGGTPGDKVRSAIKKAGPQLSTLSKKRYPSILVLYNNLPFVLGNPTEPYNIKVGMYGLERIDLNMPRDFKTPTVIVDRKFGKKRKLTKEHNTSISALAVLPNTKEKGLWLDVYHNEHAAIELPKGLVSSLRAAEFVLSEKIQGEFQEWRQVAR